MMKWRRKKKEAVVEQEQPASSVKLHQGASEEVDAVLTQNEPAQGSTDKVHESETSSSTSSKKVSEKSSASLRSVQEVLVVKPKTEDRLITVPRKFSLWRKIRAKKVNRSQVSVQSSKVSLSTSSTAELSNRPMQVVHETINAGNPVFGMIQATDEPIEWNESDHAIVRSYRGDAGSYDLSQTAFDTLTQDASSPTEKHRNYKHKNNGIMDKFHQGGAKRGGLRDRKDLNAIVSDSSTRKKRVPPMAALNRCQTLSNDSWSTITESDCEDGESLGETLTASLVEGDEDTLLSDSILDSDDEGTLNTYWDHDTANLQPFDGGGCQQFDRALMKAFDAHCIDTDLGDESLDGRFYTDEIFVLKAAGENGRQFQKVI